MKKIIIAGIVTPVLLFFGLIIFLLSLLTSIGEVWPTKNPRLQEMAPLL